MLRIHRDDFRIVLLCLSHNQLACADKRLLIGKANALMGTDCRQGGLQSYHAHNCRNDAIRIGDGCCRNKALLAPHNLRGKIRNHLFQLVCRSLGGHDSQLGSVLPALLGHALCVAAGGQCRDRKS